MENQQFTGRQELLDTIKEHFKSKGTRLVLSGMAGVGKTELALKYTYATRESYLATFWVSAEFLGALENGLRNLQSPVAGQKSLVIIDNIDTADGSIIDCLHQNLPCSSTFDILLTTRSDSASRLMSEILEVDGLETAEAVDLLKVLTPDRSPGLDEDEFAKEIVQCLGHLPLAISQCAGYINKTRTSFQDYPDDPEEVLSRTLGNSLFVQRLNAGKKQIFATFEILWDYLGREDPAARDLMCLLSTFAREVEIDMILGGLTEHRKWFPSGKYEMAKPHFILPFLEPVTTAPHLLEEMIGTLCDVKMVTKAEGSIYIHAVRY